MLFYNQLHIIKPQSETFHIVHIPCWDAVEFIKNHLDIFPLHPNSVIGNCEVKILRIIPGANYNVWNRIAVFHCIIQQVIDHICDMNLIDF
ncbi:hypothetical protein D3C86_1439410 [compost metagenome]